MNDRLVKVTGFRNMTKIYPSMRYASRKLGYNEDYLSRAFASSDSLSIRIGELTFTREK